MIESDMNLHYPIEYLVFQLEDPSSVDEFIRKDKEVWTAFLEKSPAFYYKEMWVNDSNPGEVHSIIAWKDMEQWKSITKEQVIAVDHEFAKQYTKPYKITRRIHSECNHQLFLYNIVINDGK